MMFGMRARRCCRAAINEIYAAIQTARWMRRCPRRASSRSAEKCRSAHHRTANPIGSFQALLSKEIRQAPEGAAGRDHDGRAGNRIRRRRAKADDKAVAAVYASRREGCRLGRRRARKVASWRPIWKDSGDENCQARLAQKLRERAGWGLRLGSSACRGSHLSAQDRGGSGLRSQSAGGIPHGKKKRAFGAQV